MTSIKIGKDTAKLLGVISRGKDMTVEELILDALRNGKYSDDVKSALDIMEREDKGGEKK